MWQIIFWVDILAWLCWVVMPFEVLVIVKVMGKDVAEAISPLPCEAGKEWKFPPPKGSAVNVQGRSAFHLCFEATNWPSGFFKTIKKELNFFNN